MNRRCATGSWAWLVSAGLVLATAGAALGQTAAPAAGDAPAASTQVSESQRQAAMDAAWQVLVALRDYVHAARIMDDPQRRTKDLTEAGERLVSLATHRPGVAPEMLEAYVKLWPAVVARYVAGFEREALTVQARDRHMIVSVVAANPVDAQVHAEVSARLTEALREQGYDGEELARLRDIRLKRELLERGIGYPIEARINLAMRQVDGQWKAIELDIEPVRSGRVTSRTGQPDSAAGGAATQPVPVVR